MKNENMAGPRYGLEGGVIVNMTVREQSDASGKVQTELGHEVGRGGRVREEEKGTRS